MTTVERLSDILSKVNEWLKFAEAKNSAIIVFNSALSFGILQVLSPLDKKPIAVLVYISLVIILLTISSIVALLSFVARFNPPWVRIQQPNSKSDNLLYFGHICKYTPDTYLQAMRNKLVKSNEYDELEKEYADQIVVNSKIAFIKFQQFNIAVWFTISAILTPLGAFIIAQVKSHAESK